MTQTTKGNKWLTFTLVVAGIFVLSGFFGLLGSKKAEVDINSGKVRVVVSAFGVILSESIQETRFSMAVEKFGLGTESAHFKLIGGRNAGPQLLWGTGKEASGSPDYARAVAAIHGIMISFELNPIDEDRKRQIVAEVLRLLQKGDVKELERIERTLAE